MATAKKTDTKVVPFPGDPEVTAELSRALGLSDAEVQRAVKELSRNLTHAELGVLAALWSERSSQKSARTHTRRLPTSGAHVLRGGASGAAALDLGDHVCVTLSLGSVDAGESAGATVGSVLRDVVAAGAEPVAMLDALRLGAPGAAATRDQLRDVAARLAGFAKSTGVSFVGGDLRFDRGYTSAPLAQTLAIGVARTDSLVESRASGLGSTLIYAGAAPEGSTEQRRLTEGCLSALRLGSIEGAAAVGGAGLAGAAVVLAAGGDTGVELDLDALPRKGGRLSPFDALCSPVDAVLLAVRKGREDIVLDTLRQKDVEARVIGRVTNTGRLVCKAAPEETSAKGPAEAKQAVVADLPLSLLTQDAPSYERPLKAAELDRSTPAVSLKRNEDAESELVRLLGSVNIGSRDWLLRRLDAGAKGAAASAKSLASDAAVVTVSFSDGEKPIEKLLAISMDGNGRYARLDPRQGAAMAVAECARNVVCAGGEPLGLAHALSYGSADQPETQWHLSESVDGVRDACLALKLPVVQGSVTFREGLELATPCLAVIGHVRDPGDRLGIAFGRQADMVALLGAPGTGNLAGSEFLVARTDELRGKPLTLDLGAEVKLQRAVLELAREKLLSSAHDVSEGGLGVTLSECCIAGRIGCSVELPSATGVDTLAMLFHEEPSRVVVSFAPEQRAKVQERCEALGVPFALLGFVGGDTLEIEDVLDVPVQVLAESHSRALANVVEE